MTSKSETWAPKGVVAVIDTSVLVAARLARISDQSSSAELLRLAGAVYDSFTSPAILNEAEDVLARPAFGISAAETRRWLDAFLRRSRQVDHHSIPSGLEGAVGQDVKDSPVLQTALAIGLHPEGSQAIQHAATSVGCFIVSWDRHFQPGRNVWGWTFIRPDEFVRLLSRLD